MLTQIGALLFHIPEALLSIELSDQTPTCFKNIGAWLDAEKIFLAAHQYVFTSASFQERENGEALEEGDSPVLISVSSYWTALFVTACSHLEKPIIWANRSGNRVFARVSSTPGPQGQAAP